MTRPPARMSRAVASLTWSLCVCVATSLAQEEQPGPVEPAASSQGSRPTVETIEQARQQLAPRLEAARTALKERSGQEGVEPPAALVREVEILTQVELLLGQQQNELSRGEELLASQTGLRLELDQLRAMQPDDQPGSFLELETMRGELATQVRRGETLEAALEAAQGTVQQIKSQYEERERERRARKEALATNKEEARTAELGAAVRAAELESERTSQELALRRLERDGHRLAKEVHAQRLELLTEKVSRLESNSRFLDEDLKNQTTAIEKDEFDRNQDLERARLELESAANRLTNLRQIRDQEVSPDPSLLERLESLRLARETRQVEVTLLGERLARLALQKQIWNRRYQTINRLVPEAELSVWLAEIKKERERLELAARLQRDELVELQTAQVTDQQKLEASTASTPGIARWVEVQLKERKAQAGHYEASIRSIEVTRQLCERLISDIGSRIATLTLGERFDRFWDQVQTYWNYEIYRVGESPITIRKLVIGLVLLILGMIASRVFSRMVGKRLLPRLGLNEGAAAAIQTILFYVLVISVGLFALRFVNVPLTAFTILGGALAIGIGFGSQNLMNNFISGLILLAERPIRVGDLIAVEDLLGIVEHIGPRSTRVRKPSNVDIIVPNSTFLQTNVINWTLSDDRFRTVVNVGVMYGSPTREVAKLLRRAVDEHGRVLKTPEPVVIFKEFGDNALIFEIHFWIRMRREMDRRIVESDIRYRIDLLFREASIVIAYPQRDLHLDTLRPLDVRVVGAGEPATGGQPPGDP